MRLAPCQDTEIPGQLKHRAGLVELILHFIHYWIYYFLYSMLLFKDLRGQGNLYGLEQVVYFL